MQDLTIPSKSAPRELHSTSIAAQLESEIVAGKIKAGEKLDEQSLTKRFGVSRTPIREALHELVARSLAERVPYRGVLVVDITKERIEEMFEAMGEIEALCGRFAAERMTVGERVELEALHLRMSELSELGDATGYEAVNSEFHQLIFRASHNADLIDLANNLRLKLAPFRKSQLQSHKRMKRSNVEHEAIVTALIDRDSKKAEKALRRHLVSAAAEVITTMS
ncbi:GntR family transcriptional regulator [Celeribacter neptunius]|uniref:DNA-binding transcriptional regulator, GntR family n=1 Tax=Celeribacter neptunius TaxID=588602 RepID=A0A1I3NQB7_9RHOB|nr:GntR family transcriptional regulator [Celeribacter neptunius]SFJ11389.1 DNA-binding transcriptional regulator, GntR family [Celeribacter neptunius]